MAADDINNLNNQKFIFFDEMINQAIYQIKLTWIDVQKGSLTLSTQYHIGNILEESKHRV